MYLLQTILDYQLLIMFSHASSNERTLSAMMYAGRVQMRERGVAIQKQLMMKSREILRHTENLFPHTDTSLPGSLKMPLKS